MTRYEVQNDDNPEGPTSTPVHKAAAGRESFLRRLEEMQEKQYNGSDMSLKTPSPKSRIADDGAVVDTLEFLNQSGLLEESLANELDPSSLKVLQEKYTPKPSTVKKLQRHLQQASSTKLTMDERVGLTESAIKAAAVGQEEPNTAPAMLEPRLIHFESEEPAAAAESTKNQANFKHDDNLNDQDIRALLQHQQEQIVALHSKIDRLTQVLVEVLSQQPSLQPKEEKEYLEAATTLRRNLFNVTTETLPPVRLSYYRAFLDRIDMLETYLARQTMIGRFLVILRRRVQAEGVQVDLTLLIKMMVVVTVISKRVTRNAKEPSQSDPFTWEHFWNLYRMHMFVLITFFAYLVQTGVVAFVWRFLCDTNDWRKILLGYNENDPGPAVAVAEAAAVPVPAVQALAPAVQAPAVPPRPTFLGGAIAPPQMPPQPPQPVELRHLLGAFQEGLLDVLYLVGSFFFSLLPGWRPLRLEPLENPQAHQDDQEENTEDQEPEGAHDGDHGAH